MSIILKTDRLVLRPWKESDKKPFAALNADPEVREFFPTLLTQEESDRQADLMAQRMEKSGGWGFWAVEIPGVTEFAGITGISKVPFESHFTPAVEIGWRLAKSYWNKGYATEGASKTLEFAFDELKLKEIVSFTAEGNYRSRKVMEKLQMKRWEGGDFVHPLASGPLAHQVLYKLKAEDWLRNQLPP